MRKPSSLPAALVLTLLSMSALAADEMPTAMALSKSLDLKSSKMISAKSFAPLDLQKVRTEDQADREAGLTPRFAIPQTVDIQPDRDGTWETLRDGTRVWRYRVESSVASSFNFGFTNFKMTPGSKLWVYSPDFKSKFGPFTTANNHSHRQLWTPVVLGSEAIIELTVPARSVMPTLHLTQIGQGYRGFGAKDLTPGEGCKLGGQNDKAGQAKSGSCNTDVACLGANDPWQQNRRAVASQGVGGSRVCTGSLLNNTRNDGRMLYVTATHCGVTAANAPSLFVYWNFDAPTCRAPGSTASGSDAVVGNTTQTQTGATFLAQTGNPFTADGAAGSKSDVTLVEFNQPANPAFNLFWAGWDRRNIAANCRPGSTVSGTDGQCASIHHPDGDEKRITFSEVNMVTASISNASGVHWTAQWDPTPPVLPGIPGSPSSIIPGVTEPGSSGSPLYNADRRLVGVLSGGPSFCGATGSSLQDQYGKLAHAWDGLGTASTRVRDYLDPTNSGAEFIDGRSGGTQPPPPPPPSVSFFENQNDVAIPDLSTVESAITVSGRTGNAPSTLRVGVTIFHTYRGDLQIDLVGPNGTTYRLKNTNNSSADNVITTYTVNASAQPANGVWRLRVRDAFEADTGRIDKWSLQC